MHGVQKLLLVSWAASCLMPGPALAQKSQKPVLPSSCQPGQIAKWDGTSWVCAADNVSLSPVTCPAGWIPRSTGASWECVEDPSGRVAALEAATGPLDLTVNCPGDSVNAAIAGAGYRANPVRLVISGFCDEDVNLWQGNMTFSAASQGSGIARIFLFGAHRTRIEGLKLTRGIEATYGATFVAENIWVEGSPVSGVNVHDSSNGRLINSRVSSCDHACIDVSDGGSLRIDGGTLEGPSSQGAGARVADGGSLRMVGTGVRGLGLGLFVGTSGSATLEGATIENGTGNAVIASGVLVLSQTTVTNNVHGVAVEPGARATISGGVISYNGNGVGARGGVMDISGATISWNRGVGILARNASSLLLRGARIEGNAGDGIRLGDVSFMEASGSSTPVLDNSGWGLYCAQTPPSVAQYLDFGALQFSGNVAGSVSCPESGS